MYKEVTIRQRDIKDCGAACLLSIIRYYNGNISLEKIRLDTFISKDGITAFNLVNAAKKYGFDSYGIRITFEELKEGKVLLPAIAYLELESGLRHYVVVYKITSKYVLVMDPAKGMVKVKHEIFARDFKNVLLILSPISKIVKYEDSNKLYDLFINLIKFDKRLVINLFITSLILTIASIFISFYMKLIINSAQYNLKGLFITIVIIFFILNLNKVLLSYLKNYYETYLNKNIDTKLIPSFIEHIFNLPLNAISNRTTGEIITRVQELENIKEVLANMFVTLVLNLLMAIISWFVLMFINWKLTLVLVVIIVIYLLNNILWLKPINKLVEDNIVLGTEFNSILNNNLNSIISIKNDGLYSKRRIEEKLISFLSNTFNFKKRLNIYNFINDFIVEIGLFILNTLGLLFIMNNSIELIDLITYDSLYLYFINPIKEIVNLIPKYVFIKRSFYKINDFLKLEEESTIDSNEGFSNGDIVFNKIDYTYNCYDYPIKNYSLTIKKNSKVLVMGKSGSGKSTLFKLLFRLYDPINGNILVNNINIKDYNIKTIRNNICYISQDEGLYNDTLHNNITLGKDVSMEELNKVLELCQINDILDKKSLRLNTLLLEDSSNLSGGERARIIIARALLKKCDIIIFDETFSAIAESDANKMISNIFNQYLNKTIILISHFKPSYKFDLIVQGGFNG